MRLRRIAAALAFVGTAAAAAAEPAPQRILDDAEARAYAGVGRLNIAGTRHCTATLISTRLVLTAAHCLYNLQTGRRAPPEELRFVAGQRRDAYAALRGVVAAVTLPEFAYAPGVEPPRAAIALDLALLALDAPIPPEAAAALPTGGRGRGEHWIVGYGRDRAYAASIREGCAMLDDDPGVTTLDCAVTSGVSGAPVFAAGADGPEVVAVVSAMGRGANGSGVALVVPVALRVAELAAAIEALAPGAAR